jgi:hypothetical protein
MASILICARLVVLGIVMCHSGSGHARHHGMALREVASTAMRQPPMAGMPGSRISGDTGDRTGMAMQKAMVRGLCACNAAHPQIGRCYQNRNAATGFVMCNHRYLLIIMGRLLALRYLAYTDSLATSQCINLPLQISTPA